MTGNPGSEEISLTQTYVAATTSTKQRIQQFDLEPGNTMLVGYPGTNYKQQVMLLAYADPAKDQALFLQLNGSKLPISLQKLVEEQMSQTIDGDEIPVYSGGPTSPNMLFLITPHTWHPTEAAMLAGPYAVHARMEVLEAIIAGDRPDHIRAFMGIHDCDFSTLKTLMMNNFLGGFPAIDDFVFNPSAPHATWGNAFELSTANRAKELYLPAPCLKGNVLILPPPN